MKELLLHVTYITKPSARNEFIKEVLASGVLETIRKEEGCKCYEYYCATEDENKILLVEKWENEELQSVHLKQPHMKQLQVIKEKYVLETKLEKF